MTFQKSMLYKILNRKSHTPEFLYVGGHARMSVDAVHHTMLLYEL